jgi:hypothetical protein
MAGAEAAGFLKTGPLAGSKHGPAITNKTG